MRLDGDDVHWLEGRPQEQGRSVVVRGGELAQPADLTPPPFNVRTRVHEYGGGAAGAGRNGLFLEFRRRSTLPACSRRIRAAGAHSTAASAGTALAVRRWRDRCRRRRWIGVREDHTSNGEPVNAIVAVDLVTVAGGEASPDASWRAATTSSSPRLSPAGDRLAWLAWDHPNMPWNGTLLYLAELGEDGGRGAANDRRRSGGIDLSAGMVARRSTSCSCRTAAAGGIRTALSSQHKGRGRWRRWRPSSSAAMAAGRLDVRIRRARAIVCACSQAGLGQLAVLETARATLTLDLPFTAFDRCEPMVIGWCSARARPIIPPRSWRWTCVPAGTRSSRSRPALSIAEARRLPNTSPGRDRGISNHRRDHRLRLFYPPGNPDYVAPPHERPPLLVKCHGGPTSAASSTLNLGIHYWTSRGIAVLDVNYGGSTGFGRAYRDRLHLAWGVVDVDDCVNGARFLVGQGRVDGNRCVISGGSAGGYTTHAVVARSALEKVAEVSDAARWRATPTSSNHATRLADRTLSGGSGPLPRALAAASCRAIVETDDLLPGG